MKTNRINALPFSVALAAGMLILPATAHAGAPPNDTCANAIEVFLGDTAYCNVDATDDPAVTCGFGPEVWYRFTAPCTGILNVDAMQNTGFAAATAVYSPNLFGSCTCPPGGGTFGGGQQLGCIGPVQVTAGRCYYISVGGSFFFSESCGTLTLSLEGNINDTCATALPILDGTTAFCNFGATTDDLPVPGCSQFVNDVWFEYVPDCTGIMTVSTCGGATFDTRLAVYGPPILGAPCQNAVLLGCADNTSGCAGNTEMLTVPVVGGRTYKIRVGGSDLEGTGNLTVSSEPANDSCLDAIVITSGDTPFCTLSAEEGGAEDGCAAFADPGPDIWFRHVAECTGTLLVSTCNQANYNTKLAIYQGCGVSPPFFFCNLDTLLACNDNDILCPGGTSVLGVPVTEGTCYRIRLGGANNESGSGTLSLSYVGCTPPEPCPADVDDSGAVDVDDLIAVILAWGACGNCSPPNCPADIDDSCAVDVDDLIAVVLAWGDCP